MIMETDYKKLTNRCPNCGHRLGMGSGKSCTVIMGIPDPNHEKACGCSKHVRKS
jgi:hypothetical protein